MNLSDVHNKYKSRVMSTEYRVPSTEYHFKQPLTSEA